MAANITLGDDYIGARYMRGLRPVRYVRETIEATVDYDDGIDERQETVSENV